MNDMRMVVTLFLKVSFQAKELIDPDKGLCQRKACYTMLGPNA